PRLPAITVAFATGTCGSETWGGVSGASWAAENVPQLQSAGLNYVVSTGGEAGTFTCTSAAGMESFIARYASPHLVGIDFDIEGGQSQSDIQNLVAAAAGAQAQYPNIQFSFTLATLGASDGSYGGVNSLGNEVVEAVLGSSLKNYVINLMTMDFGTLTSYVKSNGLAGLHFWSLDRDTPCNDSYASPTCNSISSTTPLEYTNRFISDGA